MNLDDLFAKRLAQLRNQKGVSARDMSLSLGQGAGYINNIENKNNLPSMTVFFYICTYLDVTPKEFFDFDNANPKELNSIISNLKKLSPKQLKNVSKSILQVLCKYKIVQKNLFKWTELNSVRFYVIRKISTCQ